MKVTIWPINYNKFSIVNEPRNPVVIMILRLIFFSIGKLHLKGEKKFNLLSLRRFIER